MIPLFQAWNIRRCNVAGCTEKPNTIIGSAEPRPYVAGICEAHYRAAEAKGKWDYDLIEVLLLPEEALP